MGIDMSTLHDVTPPPPPVNASNSPIDVNALPTSSPTAAPTQPLDPLSGAGVNLTQWVLAILAGVLIIILGNLVYSQIIFSRSTSDAYMHAMFADRNSDHISSLSPQLRLELIPDRDLIRGIGPNMEAKVAHESLKKVASHLAKLELENKDPQSNSEIKKLVAAVQTLNGTDETLRVDSYAVAPIRQTLDGLIDPASVSITADVLMAKKELLTTYAESAKATRDFWIQISQLILINLLLPVLTGLLGYVFATKINKSI